MESSLGVSKIRSTKILMTLAAALVLTSASGSFLAPRTARADEASPAAQKQAADTNDPKRVRNAAALADACLERFDDKLGDAAEKARERARTAHPPTTLAAQGAELARVSDKAGDARERAWVRGTARRDAHLLRVFDRKGDNEERDRAGERQLAKNIRDLKNGKIPQASDVGLAKESQDERNEHQRMKREDLKATGTKDDRSTANQDDKKSDQRDARAEALRQRLDEVRTDRTDRSKEKVDERKQERVDRKADLADERKADREDRKKDAQIDASDPGAGTAKTP